MTLEKLFNQLLKHFPDETVYLLNDDGEIETRMPMKDLIARIVVGEDLAIRFMKRYCAHCQASMRGKKLCPLCQRPTEEMTEKPVPVRQTIWD